MLRRAAGSAGVLAAAAATTAGLWTSRTLLHQPVARMRSERAGFVPRTTMVNGHWLRFLEGPAAGPPLLLLHGQTTDLWSWAPVLPALSRDYHVFAIDVPGHGGSVWDPELYNGPVLGELFADFIAFLLERSLLFDMFGPVGERMRSDALRRHQAHPGRPLVLPYVPPAMNEIYRALEHYDPAFGLAFFDGSFHDLFDHAETLSALARPVLLIHCTWNTHDGVLLGAMDDADAARAAQLLPDVRTYRARAGHGFHLERPGAFVRQVLAFARDVVDEVDILE